MLVLAACATPSLNPLYTAETVAFDDALLGTWKADDSDTTYTVSRLDDRAYSLLIKANNKEGEEWTLEMRLVKLGEHRFVDLTLPEAARKELDEEHGPLVVATHLFGRLRLEEDTLRFAHLEPSWIRSMDKEKKPSISHLERPSDQYLITATTPDLQEFVRAHADSPAFLEIAVLKRQK